MFKHTFYSINFIILRVHSLIFFLTLPLSLSPSPLSLSLCLCLYESNVCVDIYSIRGLYIQNTCLIIQAHVFKIIKFLFFLLFFLSSPFSFFTHTHIHHVIFHRILLFFSSFLCVFFFFCLILTCVMLLLP